MKKNNIQLTIIKYENRVFNTLLQRKRVTLKDALFKKPAIRKTKTSLYPLKYNKNVTLNSVMKNIKIIHYIVLKTAKTQILGPSKTRRLHIN